MSDRPENKDNQVSVEKADIQGSEGRRRFIKKAAIAAPVVLTAVSRPAWATRCTLSGQLSGNLSAPDEQCGGEGCSPGFWKNHPINWHPALPPSALFSDVFGWGMSGGPFPGSTLAEVIGLCALKESELKQMAGKVVPPATCTHNSCVNLTAKLGFHAVAALQNAANTVSFSYTVAEVIDATYNALSTGSKTDIETLKNAFDYENNLGCPYGGNAACK